jgi:hypothetical protein
MAIVRTILPRKGLVQSQHGLTGYEADQDSNWSLLDSSVAFMSDLKEATNQNANQVLAGPTSGAATTPTFRSLVAADLPLPAILASTVTAALGINGVVSGFTLGTGTNLTPSLTGGELFAQGGIYAPTLTPAIPAAPASTTSYLFYNSGQGFYWSSSAVGTNVGDALMGQVVTSASAITAVTQATKIMGQMSLAPGTAGNFTVQHFLGRKPAGAVIQLTSTTLIVFQSAMYDATNLYLNAAGASSGSVLVW